MKQYKVSQLENKNQFVIEGENERYFQSYESVVARYDKRTHKLTLGCDWDYSNTTRKHLYIFMREYCYLDSAIYSLLDNTPTKRGAIYKAIKSKLIKYNEAMR
jgi:hypothetical protein